MSVEVCTVPGIQVVADIADLTYDITIGISHSILTVVVVTHLTDVLVRLQKVLFNSTVEINDTFKRSFINDILRVSCIAT